MLLPHRAAAAVFSLERAVIRLSSPPNSRMQALHPAIAAAFRDCRRAFWSVALFSAVVNLLMLAGPLYMLQVYDRVLASHSVPTLVALSVLLCGAFALQAAIDLIRSRVVTRSAGFLDEHLSGVVHRAIIRLSAAGWQSGEAHEPVRDLDQIRTFLTGQGPIAIVDLPWIPVFLLICAVIHPWLGVLALVGGIMLASATLLTERANRTPRAKPTAVRGHGPSCWKQIAATAKRPPPWAWRRLCRSAGLRSTRDISRPSSAHPT